jgi:hypothetical protein
MVMSVADGSVGGGGGGGSRMATVFAWIARFTKGEMKGPLSSREPALVLPSAVSSTGAELGNGEVPGEIVAGITQ